MLIVCMVTSTCTIAQIGAHDLPGYTTVIPSKLEVGYSVTTLIIFPMPLLPAADKGNRDIIIQQEKWMANVLKIKAAKKDFKPTNLHVYTVDGNVYAFNVTYAEYPKSTTHDLHKLSLNNCNTGPLMIDSKLAKESELMEKARQARNAQQFISKKTVRFDVELQLSSIHSTNDWLIFGFRLSNTSSLNYDIDFAKVYIQDKKQIKRSSIQEQEIKPLYLDRLTTVVGQNMDRFVIIVPKFTIPNKKVFKIELFEKNGGRHLKLRLTNRHLLKAKTL